MPPSEDLSTPREKKAPRRSRRNQSYSDSDVHGLSVSGRKKLLRSHSLSPRNIPASYAGSAFHEPPQATRLPPPPLHWQQLKYMGFRKESSVLVENKAESAKLKMLLESGAESGAVIGVVGALKNMGLTPIAEDKRKAEQVSSAVATFFRNYQKGCRDKVFHREPGLEILRVCANI